MLRTSRILRFSEKTPNVFVAFLILSFLFRIISFYPSVINHDESTYIVIAEAILNGHLYYVDIIDTKPIGIFLLFAIFQKIFGSSILLIRILATLFVGFSGFLIYLIHKELNGKGFAPFASGLIYIFMVSIFAYYGLSPNTEHFFTFFTLFAFYLIIRDKHWISPLFAGIFFGIGFLIKYVIVFDGLGIALFLAILCVQKRIKFSHLVRIYLLTTIGFLFPVVFLFIFYAQKGFLQEIIFFTFELSGRYFVESNLKRTAIFLLDFIFRFFIINYWFIYVLVKKYEPSRKLKLLIYCWVPMVIISIILPGKNFGHYVIQLMIPVSLLAGSYFDLSRNYVRFWRPKINQKLSYLLIVSTALLMVILQYDAYVEKDIPREIQSYLKVKLHEDDLIYTSNSYQILYHLLDKESPTKYVHPSLLSNENNLFALKIDHNEEMNKLLNKEPKFIVFRPPYLRKESPLISALQEKYQLDKRFENGVEIHELKN